ncbi:MAG: LCP family protein [Parcubacteria group bacterium]|jgi:LCP family protein required for cell wall assembly
MKKILIFPISLYFFLAFFISPVGAEKIVPDDVEHVDSTSVTMNIKSDSTIAVTEKFEYDYAGHARPGVTRYIPITYRDLDGKKISIDISDVNVTDENENPLFFSQDTVKDDNKNKSYLAITIIDDQATAPGAKSWYSIHYTVSGAIRFKSNEDQLFWDATGDRWSVYVAYPEIKIYLPQKIDRNKVTKSCFIGLKEATIDCIDRIENRKDPDAYFSYKGTVSYESMTTLVKFPKGVVQKTTSAQQSYWSALKDDYWKLAEIILLTLCLFSTATFFVTHFKKIIRYEWRKRAREIISRWKEIRIAHAHRIRNKSRKWWIGAFTVLAVVVLSGLMAFWKIDNTLNKISTKGESVSSIAQASLGGGGQIKGESDGRINLLLLGMLGAGHPGGGLNTDTIMVVSVEPKNNRMSMISIPRDLWVTDPGRDSKSKINAVYAYGEEKGTGRGIIDMENLIGDITGLQIHYTAVVSTQAFSRLVDTLGGVEVKLKEPFSENIQFNDVKVCDSDTYTVPTGETEQKKNEKGKVVAEYPLCKNKTPECGENFSLPAGKNNLTGAQALCFVRSRYETSDFERAKRQQLIIGQIKEKATQLGIMDFSKVNSILDNMGDNVRTDMQLWEMRRLFDIYKGMDNPKVYQRVLEDSKEGLLYSPDKSPETGFILLPRGDNYDKIRDLFKNIFFMAQTQSDIKPKI